MNKGYGEMGLVSFEKGTVKIVKLRAWVAIVFFILVCVGVVVLVSWGIHKIQDSRLGRVAEETRFKIQKAEIATPAARNDNRSEIYIVGAGDEGIRQTWTK